MAPTILLFDIDGTILSSGGAGRRAMERAFAQQTGRADACESFSFAGMTDRAIAEEGLRAVGATSDAAAIDALLDHYLAALAEEVPRAPGYRVHDGIEDAIVRAEGTAQCAIGLGTGNVRQGARLKLQRAGLFERFRFGGFGCDHKGRAELLAIGAARGAAILAVPLARCRVVVIGDTPRDVLAAKEMGGECVAVATGGFSVDELERAGAEIAVPDLRHPTARTALFGA
jgi:phosphoglycolate phosphatase